MEELTSTCRYPTKAKESLPVKVRDLSPLTNLKLCVNNFARVVKGDVFGYIYSRVFVLVFRPSVIPFAFVG